MTSIFMIYDPPPLPPSFVMEPVGHVKHLLPRCKSFDINFTFWSN